MSSMSDLTIRVLEESDWPLYRQVRLAALRESPQSFTATLADEEDREEQFWRDRMVRSQRLLAERDHKPQGIVSIGPYGPDPSSGEIFGLYVFPEARGSGVSWALVEAAQALAIQDGYRQLYYWVGTDNPRALGFAENFGFRLAHHRRPAHASDVDLGDQEIAMVMPLGNDGTSVPNPTSGRVAPREGPM
jgi:GNAT superfamily N-acetyltransferase